MKAKLRAVWHRIRENKHFWRNFLMFTGSLFICFISVVTFWVSSFQIPDFHSFEDRKVVSSTKIYDRTGQVLLWDIHQDVKRTNVPFEEMSPYIKNATVAIEDSEFYNHRGIRISSIARAVLANIFHTGKTQGGSTITQQLVKNALLTQEKSYTRKVKEWVLALKIDHSLPKDKILEYYLNEAPYGGNLYGIEEASETYFGKKAFDLTLPEAAYLAAIPQSPSILSPYGRHVDRLEERKNLVLSRMHELGFITDAEYAAAKSEVVTFIPQAMQGIRAPHFVFFIKDYLESKYGVDEVENGGLNVITTIDATLQDKAEQIVKEGALQNAKDWNGSNAALVAIDPKTGQILTMVGSRNYFDKEIDGNFNVATANRQPGSSFKPFIYATAFNKGFTPNTVLFDLPTEFQSTCNAYGKAVSGKQSDCYMPQNYDGKFRGPMSLRNALAQSINVPAVKLFYLAGLADSLHTAEEMGITTLTDPARYGLTLVIGGGEVSPLDMASAYGVFADDGIRNPYTGILKVTDTSGRVLEEFAPSPKEVLPKNTALMISDILSDNLARTPTFGSNSSLNIPGHDVAAKTGTTNNNKDAWTIGYTPSISVAVWAGNNDNTPMKKGGVAVAGPIWNKFMNEAFKILPNETFEAPDLYFDPAIYKPVLRGQWQGNESVFIDSVSGKLATASTPLETRQERVITNVHTILYWIDRNNVLGPAPTNPESNAQFSHWEIPVQAWWAQHRGEYGSTSLSDIPTDSDDVHTETARPVVTILSPDNMTVYPKDERINLKIEYEGKFSLKKIDIFINNNYMGTVEDPFNFSFVPEDLDNLKENNEIKIISYDEAFNRGETVANFQVED